MNDNMRDDEGCTWRFLLRSTARESCSDRTYHDGFITHDDGSSKGFLGAKHVACNVESFKVFFFVLRQVL